MKTTKNINAHKISYPDKNKSLKIVGLCLLVIIAGLISLLLFSHFSKEPELTPNQIERLEAITLETDTEAAEGNFDKAKTVYEDAIESANEELLKAYLVLAKADFCFSHADYECARGSYELAQDYIGLDAQAYFKLGISLNELGKQEEAKSAYEQALRRAKRDGDDLELIEILESILGRE